MAALSFYDLCSSTVSFQHIHRCADETASSLAKSECMQVITSFQKLINHKGGTHFHFGGRF